jgi:acetolactate synthase-1/2/3 large subunit
VKEQFVLDEESDPGDVIARATRAALAIPVGPVHIILQAEALGSAWVAKGQSYGAMEPAPSAAQPSRDSLRRAAGILASADNPIIYAGAGSLAASEGIRGLAEKLRVPVLTSLTGRGVISEEDALCFGHLNFAGIEQVLAKADAALAIGTRFSEYSTLGWRRRMPQPLVQIDINPDVLGVNEPVSAAVIGDARTSVEGILPLVAARNADSEVLELTRKLKAAEKARLDLFMSGIPGTPLHPLWVVRTLREMAQEDAIFVGEGTAAQTWLLEQAFTIYTPRTHIFPEVALAMGYGVSASIGAALACPDKPVIAILGDGSLKMQLGELATATTLRRGLVFVVFNDGYYNALRIRQEHQYGGRYFGVELPTADFAAVGRGLGLRAERCSTAQDFVSAVGAALASSEPVLIDAHTDHRPLSRFSQVSTGMDYDYVNNTFHRGNSRR